VTHVRTFKSNKESILSASHAHLKKYFSSFPHTFFQGSFAVVYISSKALYMFSTSNILILAEIQALLRQNISTLSQYINVHRRSVCSRNLESKAYFQTGPGYWADQPLKILVHLSRDRRRGLVFQISQELCPPFLQALTEQKSKQVGQYQLLSTQAGEKILALGQQGTWQQSKCSCMITEAD